MTQAFRWTKLSVVNEYLSRAVGVPRTTIQSAVDRGEIKYYSAGSAGETRLVRIEDVLRWRRNRDKIKKAD